MQQGKRRGTQPRDEFEAQGFAPNQVPVNNETLPDAETVQRTRRHIERKLGHKLESAYLSRLQDTPAPVAPEPLA